MTQEFGLDSSANQGFAASLAAPTYYQVLNVDPAASRLMVRESYLRLKSLFQSGGDGLYGIGDPDDIQRQAAELEEAFSVLNDDIRRAEYDRGLGINTPSRPGVIQTGGVLASLQTDGWVSPPSDTIQTSRSTLKVIKTRANRADDPETQKALDAVVAEADLGDGATLLRLRQLVGASDVEVQERTKISLEYIRAMENNRFDRLPQVVYVKGFMRSYLKYLCIPKSEEIIRAFAARLEAWQLGVKQ